MKKKYIVNIGDKFNKLTILEEKFKVGRRWFIKCKCKCGNEYIGRYDSVINGHTKSCGCSRIKYKTNKDKTLAKSGWQRKYYKKNKEQIRENKKKYRELNREKIRDYSKQYKEKNKIKIKAHTTLLTNVKNGNIIKPDKCSVCGGNNYIEAHHEDYSKPLDVIWLCKSCHQRLHGLGLLREDE